MKQLIYILIAAFFIASPLSLKSESWKGSPSYKIDKVTFDPTLQKNEASFVFKFEKGFRESMKFSFNRTEKILKPDQNGKCNLILEAKSYKFQFFYNLQYYEIFTDSIPGKSNTKTEISIYFEKAGAEVLCFKPVIYLYPQKEMEVNVKLELPEKFTFTYPVYNNGWKCTASPTGDLKTGNTTYPYLFWEGAITLQASDINLKEGYIVNNENLIPFFEEKLKTMGLSSKESADFITYWCPKMNANKQNYVHFLFNSEFEKYAPLSIDPKPDSQLRVFMVWNKVDENKETLKPIEQKIPTLKRNGFTVVEWGGTELQILQNY